jgi:excisionase family DNA binding protein
VTNGSQLMSLSEVAEYLSMAERTIYVWAQQGKIPSFKLGSSWRFKRSEIDVWLEEQRIGSDVAARRKSLVDPVSPPMPKSLRERVEREEYQNIISDCENELLDRISIESGRTRIWVDDLLRLYPEQIVNEVIEQLTKQKRIQTGLQDVSGMKLRYVERKD